MTKENLKKYPFARSFKKLELMVIKHASEISNSSERYKEFVATLVRDSVIRCALEMLDVHDVKRVKVKIINCSLMSLEKVYTQLLIKYVSLGVLSYELNLLMSGIYVHGQAKFNTTPVYKLLRVEDDFADSEHQYFVFYGNTIDGKRFPVTVMSTETPEKIQKRHEFYFSGVSAVNNNMRRYSQFLKDKPERLLIGRAVSVNFEKEIDEEISPISILPKGCYTIERA